MTLSLARRAAHWPDRRALVDVHTGRTSTYADLASAAETAAGRLATCGVGPGDRVAVLARNAGWQVSLLFGVWRRGGTLAPISHRLSADTVAALLERVQPTLVVHDPEFEELAAETSAPARSVGSLQDTEPTADPRAESDVEPLFLHTGGTTGVPKVVPITERQLEWNAITEATAWGLDEDTVSVNVLPLFHTGGWNLQTLPTLYAGGTVVLPRGFDPGQALALTERYGATQWFAVAAIYRAMAEHSSFADTDFSTVDWFMSGGGPCPEAVMAPYRERGETFLQGYGLTEGGPNDLYYSAERAATTAKPESVGRPFPDVEARIVDDEGTVLTGAATGELELSGPVTAERYLETTDGTFAGEWVSTGDLVRRDEDGDYVIVGRTDNMFVSGGENVYPEVIEAALERHPAVVAAGVVPVPDERWGQAPRAVYVGDVDPEELAAFAREHLADYERPAEWSRVDELPETGAGKLDREALATREGS